MQRLLVLVLTGLLVGAQTAKSNVDGLMNTSSGSAVLTQQWLPFSNRPMLLPPVVVRSAITSRPRQSGSRRRPSDSHPRQALSAASFASQDTTARLLRDTILPVKEHRPPYAPHPPPQLNIEPQQVSLPPLSAEQQVMSVPRNSILPPPNHMHNGRHAARGVHAGKHTLAAQHPLGDPSRSDLLIKNLQMSAANERHHIPLSDGALGPTSRASHLAQGTRRREGYKAASNNMHAATSVHVHHGLAVTDPPRMENGFGGNLLSHEPLRQSDGDTESSGITATPQVPAQRRDDPPAPQASTVAPAHSVEQQRIDSPLRSLFSSPMLLLLGTVFAASAVYMVIAMDGQVAQQRIQQAQLSAAFSGQPFREGRRRRGLTSV